MVATLISFAVKVTVKLTKFTRSSEEADKKLASDMETLKKEQAGLRKELVDRVTTANNDLREEFYREQAVLRETLLSSHDELSAEIKKIEERRLGGVERTRIIMDGVEATLSALHNEGHNGPVTKALQSIKDYKSKKAAQ